MKKMMICLMALVFSGLVMANPYTPGSQSWHNWNAMAQSEADKRNAERENQNDAIRRAREEKQRQAKEERERAYYKNNPYANEKIYSMILLDENSGNAYWNLRFFIDGRLPNPDKSALNSMEILFQNHFNLPAEKRVGLKFKHFYFEEGEKYAVVRGRDKTNQKWNLWIMEKKKRNISQKQLAQDALQWCNTEADNCEAILSVPQ